MKLRNSTERYGAFHQLLHWLIGFGMIGMVALGFYMEGLDVSDDKWALYGLHKSLGITLLILVALRLFWRFTNPVPHLPVGMPRWQVGSAHLMHIALYAVMVGMPVGGWLMSSAGGHPVNLWGWIELPALTSKDKAIGTFAHAAHFWGGWMVVAFVSLHVIGALYHQFICKDGLLMRMLPCRSQSCPFHSKDDATIESE